MSADLGPLVGGWLLTYLIHSTLLLGGAWLVTRRLVQSAAARDMAWKAALVGGLLSTTVQSGLGGPQLGGAVDLELGPAAAPTVEVPLPAEAGPAPSAGLLGALARAAGGAVASPPASEVVEVPVAPSALTLGLAVYAALALALTGLYLVRRARAMRRIGPRHAVQDPGLLAMLARLRESGGVQRSIRLTTAGGLASPVALGWNEIVVPEAALTDLDVEQQRSLLAHELAHLVRHDPLWLSFACLLERLFFIQPFNHLARVRLQEAAEYLCDDWAVHRTGSGFSLASCLVKVAEWIDARPATVPLAGMAERRSQLVSRVHRLIEGRAMSAPRSLWLFTGAVTLVALTAVAAPGISTGSQPDSGDPGVVPTELVAEEWPAEPAQYGIPAVEELPAEPADTDDVAARRRIEARNLERAARRMSSDVRRLQGALATTGPVPPGQPLPPMAGWSATAPMPPRTPMPPSVARPAIAPQALGDTWRRESRQGDTTSIAVPALMVALKDSDVEVRRAAVQSLGSHEDRRAVPALIEALKDSDAEVRAGAAMVLGQLEDARAAAPIAALLKDGSVHVRRAALWALSNLPGNVSAEAVLSALADGDAEVRHAALSLALSRMEEDEDGRRRVDPRFVAAFTRMLGDANPEMRGQAAMALGQSGLTAAPAALLALTSDKNAEVRQQTAQALGQIGDPKSVPALKALLQDGNADVREQAVYALSEVRDQAALEALVGALKSSDPVVRRNAAQALGHREEWR